MVTSLLRENV